MFIFIPAYEVTSSLLYNFLGHSFAQIFVFSVLVQWITKLTVQIILRILSLGSDNFSDQQKSNKQTKQKS